MIFENGIVIDKVSNKSFSYWDFSQTEEYINIEIPEILEEEELNEFQYQNKQKIEIKTINEIVTGKYKYVHDLTFSNMLHARIIRPPNYYSRFISIDQNIIKKLEEDNIKLIQDQMSDKELNDYNLNRLRTDDQARKQHTAIRQAINNIKNRNKIKINLT